VNWRESQSEPAEAQLGDAEFMGVNRRLAPDRIPPGFLCDAQNVRMTQGDVRPRLGVVKPRWLNARDPVDAFYGVGTFCDPNGTEWVVFAADGFIFRCRPGNARSVMAMPAAVRVRSECTFVQAFQQLVCLRGRHLAPLIMQDLDTGWEDLLPHWDETTAYAESTQVAYGPFQSVKTLTTEGDCATVVTTAEHGYVTGADITIAGATDSKFNGRFNITVVDATTFTYVFEGATAKDAEGTITCSNMAHYYAAASATSAGESPDTASAKWTRVWDVLPNALVGVYVNNRLIVATAYTPADDDTTAYTAGSYTKVDFLVAADIQDPVHFTFTHHFRINQGDDSEIVDLVKYDNDTLLVFKGKCYGIITGIQSGDLNNVTLDLRSPGYGLCARGAAVVAGKDVVFVSSSRGVVSLNQTTQGLLQSVDLPLSRDIDAWIRTIRWAQGQHVRVAYWSNGLYVACPMEPWSPLRPVNAIPPEAVYALAPLTVDSTLITVDSTVITADQTSDPTAPVQYDVTAVLTSGVAYRYVAGREVTQARRTTDAGVVTLADGDLFTANGYPVTLWAAAGQAGVAVTAEFQPQLLVARTNTAVLVYDFQRQAWAGRDRGEALCPQEFFKATWNGRERLYYLGEDGWVNLMEEAWAGDQVAMATRASGLGWTPVETQAQTRGYRWTVANPSRFPRVELAVAVWNARFSLTAGTGAAKSTRAVLEDQTFSRTRYLRPFDAAPWDATNAAADFAAPNRGDYSVLGNCYPGGGLTGEKTQAVAVRTSSRTLGDQYVQFLLTNNQGRCSLQAVAVAAGPGTRRYGVLI